MAHELYWISTASGFVKEVEVPLGKPSIQKTIDPRQATTYTSFDAADDLYRAYCKQRGRGEYYVILSNVAGTPV